MKTQKIEASKTAIVLIETQHDSLKPGGAMYPSIAGQFPFRTVTSATASTRAHSAKRVHRSLTRY